MSGDNDYTFSLKDLSDDGDDGDSAPDVPSSARIVGTLIVLLGALGVMWFIRPWLQGIVYAFYASPLALIALAVFFALTAYGYRRDSETIAGAGTVLLFAIIVVGGILGGMFASENIGKQTMNEKTDVQELSDVDAENPRVVPKAVAARYASNTLNYPQYQVVGRDITIHNETPYWSSALSPDGWWNHLTKQQHGTVLVDMTEQNTQVKTVEGDMKKGIGTAFYNSYKWHLLKHEEYLVSYHDPFMVVHENEQYVAVPYTKPNFHLTPLPHTTPEWGGVALIGPDGETEDLSPEEARQHPALSEQKLYPFWLAERKVGATKYRNGIINTFTSHNDEIEVAPVPGKNNDQPFFSLTEDGPKYVVAVEPYGNAQGLKEIWTVDARTGEYERYRPNASLFGPRKAADYVRQAARTTDWNRFNPSEPLPVVVDGTLYWQVQVVPNDASGVSYIAFVNAQSSDVREVEQTSDVRAFLRGEAVTPRNDSNATDGPQGTPTVVVQRVAPNGTVLEEMAVYGDESVRIVQPGANTTANTSANTSGRLARP